MEVLSSCTGSKLGKKYVKAAYCHLAHLTYVQGTSCEMPGWLTYKLESKLLGEISTSSNTLMILLSWVGWHHPLSGHEFEQALGVGDG